MVKPKKSAMGCARAVMNTGGERNGSSIVASRAAAVWRRCGGQQYILAVVMTMVMRTAHKGTFTLDRKGEPGDVSGFKTLG